MTSTKSIGVEGENLACLYLLKNGYLIKKRNWYCDHGEIDIICSRGTTLVFVEVKYVTSAQYIYANELFNYIKITHLRRSIGIFLKSYKLQNVNWRLDLLCITKEAGKFWVEHYTDVLEDM